MSARSATAAVPVVLELGRPLHSLADDPFAAFTATDAARGRLNTLLEDIGLPGVARVTAATVDSPRALRVRVHGRLVAFAPESLSRAWAVVAPHKAGVAEAEPESAAGFPDDWLGAFAASSDGDLGLVLECLGAAAADAVSARPAALVGEGQVIAWWRAHGPEGEPPPTLAAILGGLVDLGFSVGKGDVAAHVSDPAVDGAAALERAAADLEPGRLEVRAHPRYLEEIFGRGAQGEPLVLEESLEGAEEAAALFRNDASFFFLQNGIRVHDVRLVPTEQVPFAFLEVRVNDRPERFLHAVLPGDVLVYGEAAEVESSLGAAASVVDDPLGHGAAAAVAGAALATDVRAFVKVWTAAEYIALAALGAVQGLDREGRADRLLSADDLEFELAWLGDNHRTVVDAALRAASPASLVSLVRSLVRERVPVRDLPAVMRRVEELRAISATAVAGELLDDGVGRWPCDDDRRLAFVRVGLRHSLVHHLLGDDHVQFVVRCDDVLERAVRGRMSEAAEERVRDAMWDLFDPFDPPIVVARPRARAAVRRLLAPEFPSLGVLTDAELGPEVTALQYGSLTLPR